MSRLDGRSGRGQSDQWAARQGRRAAPVPHVHHGRQSDPPDDPGPDQPVAHRHRHPDHHRDRGREPGVLRRLGRHHARDAVLHLSGQLRPGRCSPTPSAPTRTVATSPRITRSQIPSDARPTLNNTRISVPETRRGDRSTRHGDRHLRGQKDLRRTRSRMSWPRRIPEIVAVLPRGDDRREQPSRWLRPVQPELRWALLGYPELVLHPLGWMALAAIDQVLTLHVGAPSGAPTRVIPAGRACSMVASDRTPSIATACVDAAVPTHRPRDGATPMLRFIAGRVLQAIPVLFLIMVVSFGLMQLAPGGPAGAVQPEPAHLAGPGRRVAASTGAWSATPMPSAILREFGGWTGIWNCDTQSLFSTQGGLNILPAASVVARTASCTATSAIPSTTGLPVLAQIVRADARDVHPDVHGVPDLDRYRRSSSASWRP